jgi:hypothetical protein
MHPEGVPTLILPVVPEDARPRHAIEQARAWVRGEVTMTQAPAAGGHGMGAARSLHGAPRHAAYAAGQAGRSPTSPRTSSVRPPMQSRPHVLPRRQARARPQGDLSTSGSVTSFRRRFASSYSTTSGCGTTSAGQCLTAERAARGASTAGWPGCCRWSAGARRTCRGGAIQRSRPGGPAESGRGACR